MANIKASTAVDVVQWGGVDVPGASSVFRTLSLLTTAQDIKTSAGQVYGWYVSNNATSARFIKFYNKAAATQADTPVMIARARVIPLGIVTV